MTLKKEILQPLTGPVEWCIHVTCIDFLESIVAKGLEPRIGPLSSQMEVIPRIYMFHSWENLENANWLFGDAWPHENEPALLCINTQGLDLDYESGFEAIYTQNIEPARITVLAPNEMDWDEAKSRFLAIGGNEHSYEMVAKMPYQNDTPSM